MTSRLSTEDQIAFSEGLAAYQYINDNGRLDLENFCVTLAACMLHDGTGFENVARPENFHSIFLELMNERVPDGMMERWVQSQRIVDWAPQHAYLYPTKNRTCIHVAALFSYSPDWISLIGSHVLEIPDDECRPEYFGWVKESWQFTHMFLSGYHNALFSFVKKMDLKWSSEGSSSQFEALQLTVRDGLTYDDARQKLDVRNMAWESALLRINNAINDKYYLEAITLSENFISNMLYNYLLSKGKVNSELNFNSLIQKCRQHLSQPSEMELIEQVDSWRKSRNHAIHNFISSSIDDLTENTDKLTEISIETAKLGQQLTGQILEWYRSSAVNFINHNFPRSQLDS